MDILKKRMEINLHFWLCRWKERSIEKVHRRLDGIKDQIKAINDGKENDYEKDYKKIKFNSDDDLLLNKTLKFHAMTIIIRSGFEEDDKLYPQILLDDTLYEL